MVEKFLEEIHDGSYVIIDITSVCHVSINGYIALEDVYDDTIIFEMSNARFVIPLCNITDRYEVENGYEYEFTMGSTTMLITVTAS